MKKLLKDLLNTLGLGVYGVMPSSVENWCGRLKSFAPSFEVTCLEANAEKRVYQFYASEDDKVIVTYILNGCHIKDIVIE